MNVADKDLCEELFRLSGWHNGTHWSIAGNSQAVTDFPRYDLGYLIRKLPHVLDHKQKDSDGHSRFLQVSMGSISAIARYGKQKDAIYWARGDTPENATARLAIELFKSKILKRGDV